MSGSGKNRGLARRAGTAIEAERVAIVCEGVKTEGIYFTGIRQEFRLSTTRVHVAGTGFDPVKVVEEGTKFLSDYDHVWAVFDVEAPQPHARLSEALSLADKYKIRCAVSNPCFEVWLLLHFQEQTAYLDNTRVRQQLKQCGCSYDDKYFDFAAIWPHHQVALERATKLDIRQQAVYSKVAERNPWTTVHELVTQLLALATPAAKR